MIEEFYITQKLKFKPADNAPVRIVTFLGYENDKLNCRCYYDGNEIVVDSDKLLPINAKAVVSYG